MSLEKLSKERILSNLFKGLSEKREPLYYNLNEILNKVEFLKSLGLVTQPTRLEHIESRRSRDLELELVKRLDHIITSYH